MARIKMWLQDLPPTWSFWLGYKSVCIVLIRFLCMLSFKSPIVKFILKNVFQWQLLKRVKSCELSFFTSLLLIGKGATKALNSLHKHPMSHLPPQAEGEWRKVKTLVFQTCYKRSLILSSLNQELSWNFLHKLNYDPTNAADGLQDPNYDAKHGLSHLSYMLSLFLKGSISIGVAGLIQSDDLPYCGWWCSVFIRIAYATWVFAHSYFFVPF